jgi:hypothetical protein
MVETNRQDSTAPANELLIKEFENLGIQDVPNFLTANINNFLNTNGNFLKFPEVKNLLDSNKPIDAFIKLSDQYIFSNIKITGPKIVRKNIKNLQSFINDVPKRVREVPDTFTLGTQAHRVVERLTAFGLPDMDKNKIALLFDKNKVYGFENKDLEDSNQEELFSPDNKKNIPPKDFYIFEKEMKAPMDSSLDSWLYSIIKENLLSIYSRNMFPDKPFDVAQLLKDETCRNNLLICLQAAHVLLNVRYEKGLSLWRINKDNVHEFKFSEIDEYRALNWLSILRKVVETGYRDTDNQSVLTELSLGEVKISQKHKLLDDGVLKIKGGVADVIKFQWGESTENNSIEISDGKVIPLDLIIGNIDMNFRSQSKKYNRKNEEGIIYQRELYRNINSLFSELYNLLGHSIVDKLKIELVDFKFPAGDGGWWTSYNVADLPYQEHREKLAEYLFNIVSQFCWVLKWKESVLMNKNNFGTFKDWENFGVSLNEITDFVFNNELFEKIFGKLIYQTPERDISEFIHIPNDKESFRMWANTILSKKIFLLEKTEQRIKRQRTLNMLIKLNNPTKTLETIRVSPEVFPDNLNSLFITYNSINYMVLEEFNNAINRCGEEKEWVIKAAFHYLGEKVTVFRMEKIMDDGSVGSFRVAVNNNAEFSIKGSKDFGFYRGVTTSSKVFCGVKEKVFDRTKIFNKILENLKEKGILKTYSTLTDSDKILLENSPMPLSKVENKPWVVKQDLMTGRWSIDPKALENALLYSDYPGFVKISNILSQERKTATTVFCPLPNHPNRNSEAANFYPEQNAIYCFNCNEFIYLPETKGRYISRIEKYSWPEGLKFTDYRGVSKERQNTIENFVDLSILFKDDPYATSYLNSRGFTWSDFGEKSGFIPPEIMSYLSRVISNKEFSDFRSRNRYQNIETIMHVFPDKDFEEYWDGLDKEKTNGLKELLTVNSITNFKNRALVLRVREGKEDSLGGRIIVPSYWMSQATNMLSLAPSNLIGRGVEGRPGSYKGRKYYKVPIAQGKLKGVRPTPPGIWVPDVSSFLLGYLKENLIIVFEGTTNAASFGKMYPKYRNNTVVVEGTGYRNFLAFLDWLKFNGTVCLAHDFDKGGAMAAERMKKQLEFQNFKNVIPVQDLLEKEVIKSEEIPPFDVERFSEGKDLADYKKDMNDIYLSLIKKGLIK